MRQLLVAASLTPQPLLKGSACPPSYSTPSSLPAASPGMAVPLKRGTEGTSWRYWVARQIDRLWEAVGGALNWGRDLSLRWS